MRQLPDRIDFQLIVSPISPGVLMLGYFKSSELNSASARRLVCAALARQLMRLLRVARTIADIDCEERISLGYFNESFAHSMIGVSKD